MTKLLRRSFTLSEKDRAAYHALLERSGLSLADTAIRRRSFANGAPCSFAQQRLWFLDRLHPGECLYNIPAALRLENALDVACLEASVNELVSRHEPLRTTFREIDGEPVQVIAAHAALRLAVIDLRSYDEGGGEAEAVHAATREARMPFDLERGPLLRVGLIVLPGGKQVLLVTMHHIISDGWSVEIFFRELREVYEARFHGRSAHLPELPVQYADYAAWQREWLQGEELERQLDYWRRQLGGMESLRLPTDRARPALSSYRGSREFLRIDEGATAGLKQLSREENATLFMTLLAAFQLLLSRYSGQQDIAVGTLTAGRNRVETEGLIGFFVNTVVLRTDLGRNPSFRQLLLRARDTALAAFTHADLPFEKLVEQLQPQRDLSRNPLIQVTFQIFPAHDPEEESAPRQLALHREVATFDLSLDMWESRDALEGRLEYSTDLFDTETITQFLGHYRNLVGAIVEQPDQPIAHLPIMAAGERHAHLTAWNATHREYPRGLCIHHVFEAQARRTPDALAIEDSAGVRLTFDQLNRMANRVAHFVKQRAAGPGSVVGISAERSIRAAALILGVLKAGAAYLPLDPAWPDERRKFVQTDAGAAFVLTEEFSFASCTLGDETDLGVGVSERDLAYILYTSGSSGQPKAVIVEHASLVNHAWACVERYELTARDRVLQFASLAFDVAAEEMFPTWAAGGCVVLAPVPVPSPERLARTACDVTVMNLPAPYWHEWIDTVEAEAIPPRLRLMITGSDRVDEGRVDRWIYSVGDCVRLIHAYGVTEATITSLTFELKRETWSSGLPLPLGMPIGNVKAYVLDGSMSPVPAGVEGDLYLGGRGIARGYLHAASGRFLTSPFGDGMLFNTGDRARRLRDGNIVFAGRVDDQIKIRGFRVEPAEIERHLLSIPGIHEAAVALIENASLGAWVIAESQLDVASLTRHLRGTLPEYMIPSGIFRVPSLPRTDSGKVDRKSLRPPASTDSSPAVTEAHAITDEQRIIAAIWQELLNVRDVGMDENFFELGGHSLLLLRVHSRLESRLGREVPLVELFRHPTVRSLALYLRKGETAAGNALSAVSRAKRRQDSIQRRREIQLNA